MAWLCIVQHSADDTGDVDGAVRGLSVSQPLSAIGSKSRVVSDEHRTDCGSLDVQRQYAATVARVVISPFFSRIFMSAIFVFIIYWYSVGVYGKVC